MQLEILLPLGWMLVQRQVTPRIVPYIARTTLYIPGGREALDTSQQH